MLSSRLHETGGRELKHQYLRWRMQIFESRWLKPGLATAQARPAAGFWKSVNLEICVLPKMSARSGLTGKRTSRPHLEPSQAFFPWTEKIQKHFKLYIFSLVGQWALFTRFGVMCWCHYETGLRHTLSVCLCYIFDGKNFWKHGYLRVWNIFLRIAKTDLGVWGRYTL